MFKFFAGLAIGVVGGAAVGSAITIKAAVKNPRIQKAIGRAIADTIVDFVYGPEEERPPRGYVYDRSRDGYVPRDYARDPRSHR